MDGHPAASIGIIKAHVPDFEEQILKHNKKVFERIDGFFSHGSDSIQKAAKALKQYLDRRIKSKKRVSADLEAGGQRKCLPAVFEIEDENQEKAHWTFQSCPRHLFIGPTSVLTKHHKLLIDQNLAGRIKNWLYEISFWRNPYQVSAVLFGMLEYLLDRGEATFVDWLLGEVCTFVFDAHDEMLLSGRWCACNAPADMDAWRQQSIEGGHKLLVGQSKESASEARADVLDPQQEAFVVYVNSFQS